MSKGPGNFPRWCFMNPPKIPVRKIKGSQYHSNLLMGKLRSKGEVTQGLKGFSGSHWTLEVPVMPQNPTVGLKFHAAWEPLPSSPLALTSTLNLSPRNILLLPTISAFSS